MLQKSTWLHLRIPFSLFLMPIFLFATSQAEHIKPVNWLLAFVAIHLFLYPASNAYNSYFDRDEGSIGGLENPPPVSKELYWVSLFFDLLAILIGLMVSWQFAIGLFLYGLISKAYSHPAVRLKKYPIASLLIVAVFQGFFTYIMSMHAITGNFRKELLDTKFLYPALLATFLLAGSYPMTQIYQHQEDKQRGDKTLSLLLGVKGTFVFTAIIFFLANMGFIAYFFYKNALNELVIFEVALLPVLIFFGQWWRKVLKDTSQANFRNTMLLNKISSLCLSIAFLLIFLMKQS
jgi:1,4-dihydroxy-2-naphthoate octaprenyltransferase